jgi:hypothetical protein
MLLEKEGLLLITTTPPSPMIESSSPVLPSLRFGIRGDPACPACARFGIVAEATAPAVKAALVCKKFRRCIIEFSLAAAV